MRGPPDVPTEPKPRLDRARRRAVDTVRVLAMDAVQKVGNGHPGTAMSLAPAAYLLFQKVMRHNPADPHWPGRDRFVLSCGHSSLTLYIQLYLGGWGLELEDLKSLRTWGSKTPGHPEYGHTAGVETTTGPLGQGIGNAVGMAMAARRERGLLDPNAAPGESLFDHQIYALASDGDIEEGVSSEASSIAGTQQLGNLTLIYDDNQISIEDDTDVALSEDVAEALRGLRLARAGRRLDQRRHARTRRTCRRSTRPSRRPSGSPTSPASSCCGRSSPGPPRTRRTPARPTAPRSATTRSPPPRRSSGFDPEQTFEVRRGRHRAHPQGRRPRQGGAGRLGRASTPPGPASRPPTLALFERMQTRTLPDGLGQRPADLAGRRQGRGHPQGLRRGDQRDRRRRCPSCGAARPTWPSPTTPPSRTRRRSSRRTAPPRCGRPTRTPAGCSTSASASTAWARSSTASPSTAAPASSAATFLTFSDYMRPSVRLAALMQLPVTYVWTHDSIGLGEDGPTHQPIEHLAALRAIPGLDVVRPADANETAAVLADGARATPTGPAGHDPDPPERPDLPARRGRLQRHQQRPPRRLRAGRRRRRAARRRARRHRLRGPAGRRRPASILAEKGIRARVVSMPCREWFDEQEASYRETVIPPTVKARVSVEAGIAQGWREVVGDHGRIVSLEHYGASADFERIYREFGITAEAVAAAAEDSIRVATG